MACFSSLKFKVGVWQLSEISVVSLLVCISIFGTYHYYIISILTNRTMIVILLKVGAVLKANLKIYFWLST